MLSVQPSGADIGSGSLQVEQCELALFLRLWLPLPFSSGFFWALSQICETLFTTSPTLVSPETIISFCYWQWIPWWTYAQGENYKWDGDHGRIASSIPPSGIPPLSPTQPLPCGKEVELLKEQKEQGCSTGKGKPAAEGALAPQLGKQDRAGGHNRSRKVKGLRNNHGNSRAQGRAGAGPRIPTPHPEERSVTKRWVLPSFPVSFCSLPGTGNAGLLLPSFQWHESPKASHSLTITSNLW